MKKIILVVLLALSLQASSVMCEDFHERTQKYHKLLRFALERGDMSAVKLNVGMTILYSEKALAECGDDWKFSEPTARLRKALVSWSNSSKSP